MGRKILNKILGAIIALLGVFALTILFSPKINTTVLEGDIRSYTEKTSETQIYCRGKHKEIKKILRSTSKCFTYLEWWDNADSYCRKKNAILTKIIIQKPCK